MARIKGNPRLKEHGRTRVWAFLEQLQKTLAREGGSFEKTNYAKGHHCILIHNVRLPEAMHEAIDTENSRLCRGDYHGLRVVREGGRQLRRRHARSLRKQTVSRVRRAAHARGDVPSSVLRLLEHLNGLPTNRFARCWSDEVTRELYHLAEKLTDGEARRQQHHLIARSRLQPLPIYQTAERTLRLVAANASPLLFKTALRRRLFAQCVEIDMASSQLALVASLWNVPELRRVLKRSESIWKQLIDHLGRCFPGHRYRPARDFGFVKRVCKGNTYATCFGMTRKNLMRFGNPSELGPSALRRYYQRATRMELLFGASIEEIGAAFLAHPIVAALLEARQAQLSFIEERGWAEDCFGRMVDVRRTREDEERSARSVLAELTQNAEMYVMLYPAREIMRATGKDDPRLMLWQHDGFTYKVRLRDIDRWNERLDATLQCGCRALEAKFDLPPIVTELEVKYDPR